MVSIERQQKKRHRDKGRSVPFSFSFFFFIGRIQDRSRRKVPLDVFFRPSHEAAAQNEHLTKNNMKRKKQWGLVNSKAGTAVERSSRKVCLFVLFFFYKIATHFLPQILELDANCEREE